MCLLGVAVGVMVLIVVLAVMAGFEREVKSRLLGFSPHVQLELMGVQGPELIFDWREIKEQVEAVEGVEEAYAQLRDFTILEMSDLFYPVEYRAIDTTNESQMKGLEELILKEKYGGTADMGLDDRAVVAESTARQFGIAVGDRILLHSARNLQQLAEAWKTTDRPLVAVEHAEMLAQVRKDLRNEMTVENTREAFDIAILSGIFDALDAIRQENIRESERGILINILSTFQSGKPNEEDTRFLLEPGSVESVLDQLDILEAMDREVEDGRLLRGMREVALPRELEVVGIFRTSQHVLHPAVFVPLSIGQELKNLEGGVEAIGVRVDDPYKVELVQEQLNEALGSRWSVQSWKDQNRSWVELIARERMMMYFALSFIVLVSAFCIMAVIFTITIMKKQEIGVMKALGATPFQVVRVFTFQGSIVGFLGAALGVGLGLLVVRFRDPIYGVLKNVGFDVFPADFHGIDGLPAHVNPPEVVIVGVGAFVLCAIAAFIPAFLTSRRDPASCLRNF
ncbi:MAG: hypothetical protein CMP28_14875 [Roseibacillus sp.]|nr:hypothetical protein [Roseibacillus sp.]